MNVAINQAVSKELGTRFLDHWCTPRIDRKSGELIGDMYMLERQISPFRLTRQRKSESEIGFTALFIPIHVRSVPEILFRFAIGYHQGSIHEKHIVNGGLMLIIK